MKLRLSKNQGYRATWTPEEDKILRKIVEANGAKDWKLISHEYNIQIREALGEDFTRTFKQCSDRWKNSLNPSITKTRWSGEEDLILLEKWLEYGNKWTQIQTYLPNRGTVDIKNHFNAILSKRKIDKNNLDYCTI